MHSHPTLLHLVVVVEPFSKWGIDFMHCNHASVGGHHYILISIDYFTKWAKVIPTFSNDRDIIRPRVFLEGDLVLFYD